MIYTIGYQDKKLSQLIEILDAYDVDVLVDVRTTPYSKYRDFNRPVLEEALLGRYRYEGDRLGGLTGKRTLFYDEGLEWIKKAHESGKKVCIMCMEADPKKCHRNFWIARDLEKRFGLKVEHL